jgi:hypothetical protein
MDENPQSPEKLVTSLRLAWQKRIVKRMSSKPQPMVKGPGRGEESPESSVHFVVAVRGLSQPRQSR